MSTSEADPSSRSSARTKTSTEKGLNYQKELLQASKSRFANLVRQLTHPDLERQLGEGNADAISSFETNFLRLEKAAADVLLKIDSIIESSGERERENWKDHRNLVDRDQRDRVLNVEAIYQRNTGAELQHTSKSPLPPAVNPHDLPSGHVIDVRDTLQSLAATSVNKDRNHLLI